MLGVEIYAHTASEAAFATMAGSLALSAPAARPLGRRARLRAAAKRMIDILGAGALLLLAAPAFLLLALLIRADGGPVLYAHERIGRDGRRFGCLKFRSMVVDSQARLAALLQSDPAARAEWERTRKLKDDPRVTRTGRFLRASSLDELPQLINVLRGEMSLVGPRPVVASELDDHYGEAARDYLAVRPGVTGLWQISGRSDTSYATRVALDSRYARSPSLRTDLKILLRTPLVVLLRRGAY
ncbi:sugar transferase [Roseicella frigidaeris]|uniref:Sugar transferase n=1 Tax=Roseicella frigidaeris TaxID=2230885 RepID=A0A327MAJ3_9PROT|nr:sugar transferase [Roseicella frigidaeris]RAI60311.1 sugar transferase [Roseicella frigidaeris]